MHRVAPCTTVHHDLCAPAPWCITVVVHRIAPCTTVRDRPCAPALRCIIATLHQGARCSTMCDPARQHQQPLQARTRPHRLTAPTALDTDPTPPSPTPTRQHPTPPDTTRHHPKTRQPPLNSAPSGSRSLKKRPQQASTRARIFGGLPPGFAALRPRSGAAATCAAASVHPFGAGLPTSCAACGSPQRRQSEVHCAPMGERQLGQHPCTGCCPCSLHTIVRVLWPAPFPQCGPWQGRPAAPAGRVRAHGRTQRRTVLRLLLRRPGQRPNEGAIGGRHRRIWSEMGRDSGVPCE